MPAQASQEKKTFRMQFRFWLDIEREEEEELAEYIAYLKENRSFAQTIRDALRLIWDLRSGRVEILLILFPWIAEYFIQQSQPPQIEAKISENDPLRAQLARLERLLLEQGNTPITNGTKPSQAMLPPPRPFALDDDDDIELEIKQAKTSRADNNTAYNYAISLFAVQDRLSDLPDEILEYGLRIGRIPPGVVKKTAQPATTNPPEGTSPPQEKQPDNAPPAETRASGGIKKMDVPQFAVPTFDDDDDDIDLFT